MKKPRCDWPGYKCESESEAYFQNVGDSSSVSRLYIARCSIHEPDLTADAIYKGGLPRAWFKRISLEEFIVSQVMLA